MVVRIPDACRPTGAIYRADPVHPLFLEANLNTEIKNYDKAALIRAAASTSSDSEAA